MANVIFNGFKQYSNDGTINLESDTLMCALFDKDWTPDKDTMDNWDDISADEISGTGYPAGGIALTGKAVTHDDGSDKGIFDADDVNFPAVSLINVRWVVIYKVGITTAAKLLGAWDMGADQNPVAVDLLVKWNAGGLLTWTQGS